MKRTIFALAFGFGLVPGLYAQQATHVYEYDEYVIKIIDVNRLTTVDFKKGDHRLSSAEKEKLGALAKATRNDKKVDALVVAAWSDDNYPAAKGEQVSDANKKLADDRKDEVERVLEKAGARDVSSYSMAEQPGWFAKAFNTENALLKNKGRKLTDQSKLEAEIGQRIRNAGGPGKAVVVIKFDTDAVAH